MNRPQLSDEEIRSHMDFEKLLASHRHASGSRHNTSTRVLAGMSILVVLLLAAWFAMNRNTGSKDGTLTNGASEENPEQRRSIPADSVVTSDSPVHKTESNPPANRNEPKKIQPGAQTRKQEETGTKKDTLNQRTPVKEIVPVYTQAEPVAGYQHLYEYFARELTYPVKMIPDSVEGVVSVAFTINASGRPEKITIEHSLGAAFDEEAIRLVEKMPDWKPATYGDKAVASRLSIPITFQVKKIK